MENLNSSGIKELNALELNQTHGAGAGEDIAWWIVEKLIDQYGPYVDRGCPGVYNNNGCNSIGMGLSGNTAFTGY